MSDARDARAIRGGTYDQECLVAGHCPRLSEFFLPLHGSPPWRWSAHQSRWPSTSSRGASPRLARRRG